VALDLLLVDDDADQRAVLAQLLGELGHSVREAADGVEALLLIAQEPFDGVICDVQMPRIGGMAVFERLRRDAPGTAVVLITGFANVPDVKTALRAGAIDYLTKPVHPDDLIEALTRIETAVTMRNECAGSPEDGEIIGRSPPILRLLDQLDAIAASTASVVLTGESGSGKELVAHALHQRSARKNGPFVAINCAAVPETLLEAELFGHERGAFTGAVKKRDGRFKLADGGTLLLDEVAEIPAASQAKLLRALQERAVEPIGADGPVPVDVRLISATHENLKQRVTEGRFREDLYYRLNVIDLRIPTLRERPGDLPLLVAHFLRRWNRTAATFSTRAWNALSSYPFPGNVRELAHALEHALVLSRGDEIDLQHLPEDVVAWERPAQPLTGFNPLAVALRDFERGYLLEALELAQGRRQHAAALLGISRKTLWKKLRQHRTGVAGNEDDE
jgi:DNA-binding NtrC family response regulator